MYPDSADTSSSFEESNIMGKPGGEAEGDEIPYCPVHKKALNDPKPHKNERLCAVCKKEGRKKGSY